MAEYVAFILANMVPKMESLANGATYKEVTKTQFRRIEIPLPSIEIQRALVAEIEREQSLVDSNRELIERFEKKIEAAVGRVWKE